MPVSLDFTDRFSGTASSWELGGNWPAGLSISNGVVTGTPSTSGIYKGLYVIAKGANATAKAYSNAFDLVVTAFGALVPKLSGELAGVEVGTGDLTTTHADTLYAPDHEGVYRAFGADEAVWAGGRVVRQKAFDTDFSTIVGRWTALRSTLVGGVADPFGGVEAATATCTDGSGTSRVIQTKNEPVAPQGYTAVFSCWIRRRTGTGTIQIYTGKDTAELVDITASLTSSWQRFSVETVLDVSNGIYGWWFDDTNDAIDVYGPLFETVEGQTNKSPGEYTVNAGTSGSVVTKVYANYNGNTVTDNVVTEAVGDPLPEKPYLLYLPAATNSALWSNELRSGASFAAWANETSITVTKDITGIDGTPNTGNTVLVGATAASRVIQNFSSIAAGTHTIKMWCRKGGTSVAAAIEYAINVNYKVSFNGSTGAFISETGTGNYEIIDYGDIYCVLVSIDQIDTRNPQFRIYPSDDATTDVSLLVLQAEYHLNKTIAQVRGLSPIFTTSAAVSVAKTVYNFDALNNADEMTWYMEHQLSWSGTETPDIANYIAPLAFGGGANNMNHPHTEYGGNRWNLKNTAGLNYAWSVNESVRHGFVVSPTVTSAIQNIGGVYGTENVAYSAAVNDRIEISGTGGGVSYRLRNLQRYNISSYQDGKSKIDDLMEN